MALAVLDGNQSATTLSSVITGGEHIVAHSVVSLGSTAISNITSAVSGSVVSVSNFPASQSTTFGAVTGSVSVLNFPSAQTIAGTVTANGVAFNEGEGVPDKAVWIAYKNNGNVLEGISHNVPLPISGTVTANTAYASNRDEATPDQAVLIGINNNGTLEAVGDTIPLPISGTVAVGSSVTIGAMPNGALTTRFGSVVTANLATLTSAVTNTSRKYLLAQNISAGTVTIGIGFSPTTTQGIQLAAGGGLTFDAFCPTGAIYWLSSTTGANWSILEG